MLLLVLEVAQGVVGFVQYFADLPEILVGLHMLGAALARRRTRRIALAWSLAARGRATAAEPDAAARTSRSAPRLRRS